MWPYSGQVLSLSKIEPLYKQLLEISKKLTLVLATSALVTEVSKKKVVLACIYYLLHFSKNTNKVQALINFKQWD